MSPAVELSRLEGGLVERPYFVGDATDDPIRLTTTEPLTADLIEPFRDVEVRSVWLRGMRHTDRDIAEAANAFPSLMEVFVPIGKKITDEAIRSLAPVRDDFRSFTAYKSQISDDGAKLLAEFPELRRVRLDQGRLSDVGVAALGACKKLTGLHLNGNFRIEGWGLRAFVDHPELMHVFLDGTCVSDDSVGHLAGCERLERLSLSSTKVTERCLLTLPSGPTLDVFLPRGLDQERIDAIRRNRLNLVVDGVGPDHIVDIPRAADGTPVELPPQLRSNALTFAIFSADWCAPCQWLKTTFDTVRPNLREQFKFVELNIDDHLELASALHIRSVPTVVLMQFGIVVDRFTGAYPLERLTERLEAALAL